MSRIIQHSNNFFSSRTPNPKLLTAKLEGTGTNPRPRIRPLDFGREFGNNLKFQNWAKGLGILTSFKLHNE